MYTEAFKVAYLCYLSVAGGGSFNVGMFGTSQSLNTSPTMQKQHHHHPQQPHFQRQQQQHQHQQQNNIMQNMELLLDSLNTGSFQNFDLNTWQVLMDSMKTADLQNMGVDQNQWQDFAFSFSQYLHQQGVLPDTNLVHGISPTSSNNSSIMGSSQGMLQINNPQYQSGGSPLQGSQHSYSSSASYSGSSVHSIPGIKVTSHPTMVETLNQPTMAQTRPVAIDDDDDEEFDWDSLL